MVSLSATTDRWDGVTLVTARLQGAGVAQRVRLANRLDGPVWPPRRNGVPEEGWKEGSYETVVPADQTVAVGYASPAPPTDDPLQIAEQTIVDQRDDHEATTPADVLRELGDPSPPRDAVPIPITEESDGSTQADLAAGPQGTSNGGPPKDGDDADRLSGDPARDPESTRPARAWEPVRGVPGQEMQAQETPCQAPAAVHGWLDTVEERVETAERLAAADTLPEATEALRAAGSLAQAEDLVETLQDEEATLEAIASRADRLAQRSTESDVPLATFERLA